MFRFARRCVTFHRFYVGISNLQKNLKFFDPRKVEKILKILAKSIFSSKNDFRYLFISLFQIRNSKIVFLELIDLILGVEMGFLGVKKSIFWAENRIFHLKTTSNTLFFSL